MQQISLFTSNHIATLPEDFRIDINTNRLFNPEVISCSLCGKTIFYDGISYETFQENSVLDEPLTKNTLCMNCVDTILNHYLFPITFRPLENTPHQLVIKEFEEAVPNCEICKGIYSEMTTFNNRTFCYHCFTTFIGGFCTRCHNPHLKSEFIHINSDSLCRACQSEHAAQCYDCGDWFFRDDAVFIENDDIWVCPNCYSRRNQQCDECGTRIARGSGYCLDNSSNCYCRRCYNMLVPVAEYNFKMPPAFYHIGRERKLYLGLELEIDINSGISRVTIAKDTKKLVNKEPNQFIYCKHDGTCDLELVTNPMTLNYWKTEFAGNLKSLLNYLVRKDCVSYDARSSGIHIHSTLSQYSDDQIYLVHLFFQEYRKFIYLIAQRKGDRLNEWAKINRSGRDTFKNIAKYKSTGGDKYVALRITEHGTLEYRIFRGSTRVDRVMKNLEFVHSLHSWTKRLDERDCNLDNYEEFVMKRPKTYKYLIKYLKFLKKSEKKRIDNGTQDKNTAIWYYPSTSGQTFTFSYNNNYNPWTASS